LNLPEFMNMRVVAIATVLNLYSEFYSMKNRILFFPTVALISFLGATTTAYAASSSFDTNSAGWSAVGDVAGPLTWNASGGNPGGHVSVVDSTTGGITYFVAPSSFLGNQSAALGTSLQFDLRQVYPGAANQFDAADVFLIGAGFTLAYDLPTNPANGSWTSYAVPLTASAWHLTTLAGAAPSSAQFSSVMSALTGLQIRAEYQSGSDTGSLDNVSMGVTAAIPEPETYALMLLGLGAIATAARRRKA
jgi:hypothetical protein